MLNNIAALLDSGAVAAVGDYESIGTSVVGAGGSTSISFSSIAGTYSHLQLRIIANSSTTDALLVRFNGDTGANYARHRIDGSGSSATAVGGGGTTSIGIAVTGGFPATASTFGAAVFDILDYTSTNKNKTTRCLNGGDKNGSGYVSFESGLWYATPAAITSITITPASGTITQYSSFALYGIK
jgi:hypothetical protein